MWTSEPSFLHAAEPLGLIVAVVPVSIPTVDPFDEKEVEKHADIIVKIFYPNI